MNYSFPHYLASKKSVDDRALNAQVWATLTQHWPADRHTPARVLEIGAGIGTMIERALERGLLNNNTHYTAIDAQAENIHALRERLIGWANAHAWQCAMEAETLHLIRAETRVVVHSHCADALAWCATTSANYDVVIAHAVLDLFDIPTALPLVTRAVRPGGLVYATINFDGLTIFQPPLALDQQIEQLYHRTMDERVTDGQPSGDSQAGRHLFHQLQRAGVMPLAAGSSDWVVFPVAGRYPADEAYFLHFIVNTVAKALHYHPQLNADAFAAWVAERHAQIARGELVYIAHQLDWLGRVLA